MRTKTRIHGAGRVHYQAAMPLEPLALIQRLQRRFGGRLSVATGRGYSCAALVGRFRLTVDTQGLHLILNHQASQGTQELDILAIGDAIESLLPSELKLAA